MPEKRLNKKNIEEVKHQFTRWELFLNNVIGLFAFNAALSSLGTPSPSTNASVSLIFLIALTWLGRKQFPEFLKELRAKDDKTDHENYFLAALESKHLGVKAMVSKYTVYLLGMFFLGFVCFSYLLSRHVPSLAGYLYGI